jgi:predicted AAA+ superfamily ATPase
MVKREITDILKQYAAQFKAVAITGPRQSGKTTLAKMAFPSKDYVSMEDPDVRLMSSTDPRRFLQQYPHGCILDEVQRVPALFSYLQGALDVSGEAGRFIITGSQQFGMMQEITQSLAGRVGLLSLFPFSLKELNEGGYGPDSLDAALFGGGYPPIYDQGINVTAWMNSYIGTYLERDVRQIVSIREVERFQQFLKLCAGNVGQLFNASRIGADCGVNHGTIRNWLSVLKSSFIVFMLQPHQRNYRKRLVKTPKLYFWDTALAARLWGIEKSSQLATHPLRGALFENWVVVELSKARLNKGMNSDVFFWRNNTGLEIDVVADFADRLLPIEIKSGATIASDWFASIDRWLDLPGNNAEEAALIYGGDKPFQQGRVHVVPWRQSTEVFRADLES